VKPRLFFYALVLAFVFVLGRLAGVPTGSPHRLSGHPSSLAEKLELAKRQLAHDRVPGSHHWLGRDRVYVNQLHHALAPAVDGCLHALIWRESRWNVHATNPQTGAYGLPQALPGSKMASAGPRWRDDPATQIRWMLGYVTGRYGGSCAALAFQVANGWY
jgi:hypothetical protein